MLSTIIPDTCVNYPRIDSDMTYLEKKNTNDPIRHTPKNKYMYETVIHKIYNIIVVQTN